MGRLTRNFLFGGAACIVAATGAKNALATRNEYVIHPFANATGVFPQPPLVIDSSTGALYGAAEDGGENKNGVVYQILPPTATHNSWAYSVIYDVPSGFSWHGRVTLAGGVVYVTSYQGGTGCAKPGCGMVFSLTPPASGAGKWTPTTLYSFTGGSDGANPFAPLVAGSAGVLYGTASEGGMGCKTVGCGTVFKLTPPSDRGQPWAFSVIYHFLGGKAGEYPTGGVILDQHGEFYGIASFGADYLYYKLSPPPGAGEWTETDIYRLYTGTTHCGTGGAPTIGANGTLYTIETEPCDYVIQLAPSASDPNVWVKTVMHSFGPGNNSLNGDDVAVPLTVDASGNVYGAATTGGIFGNGAIFKLEPRPGVAGKWNLKVLYTFPGDASVGANPNGGLVLDSTGAIYGSTLVGGANNDGVIFHLSH